MDNDNEHTPLLIKHGPVASTDADDADTAATDGHGQYGHGQYGNRYERGQKLRIALISAAVCVGLCAFVLVPVIYLVYIPARIRSAVSSATSSISGIHITTIGADLRARVSLDIPIDAPPVTVVMHPAIMAVTVTDTSINAESEVKTLPLARLEMPLVKVPRGASRVGVVYDTIVGDVNVGLVWDVVRRATKDLSIVVDIGDSLSDAWAAPGTGTTHGKHRQAAQELGRALRIPSLTLSRHKQPPFMRIPKQAHSTLADPPAPSLALDFDTDAWPVFSIPYVGSWVINMHGRGTILPFSFDTPDTSRVNATVADVQMDIRPQPSGKVQYIVTSNIHFTNPTMFTASDLGFDVVLSVYEDKRYLMDVRLPAASTRVEAGRNTHTSVIITTHPDSTERIMEMVGSVSEGGSVKVRVGGARIECSQDEKCKDATWLGDIFGGIFVDVVVGGGSPKASKGN